MYFNELLLLDSLGQALQFVLVKKDNVTIINRCVCDEPRADQLLWVT